MERGECADIIHAHNVLAHVADLNGFVHGIQLLLKDDGLAVIEVPYVKDLVDPALIAGSALGLTLGGALTTPGTCDMAAFAIYTRALIQAEIEAITTQMQAL